MISKFVFNGKSSEDFGILVEKLPNSIHGGRRVETYTIPGRHGSRRRKQKAYDNYPDAYEIWFRDRLSHRDAYQISGDIAAWLLTAPDDARFEDTYEPDIYRLASYTGPLDVEVALRTVGKAILVFDFQPQRFLKSGETEIQITEEITTLHNPTAYAAEPLIRVEMTNEAQVVEPVEVTLNMRSGYYIAGNRAEAGKVRTVCENPYDSTTVSQAIDVSGYETAIITAECYWAGYIAQGSLRQLGRQDATCYTFLTASGKPINMSSDYKKMEAVEVPIPRAAKWLYICSAVERSFRAPLEPSVTLIPKPTNAGEGTVTINGQTSTIAFADRSVIYLDCAAHNAYYADGGNANAAVTHTEADNPFPTFPVLAPGDNMVSMSGAGVTATIKPRWWRL